MLVGQDLSLPVTLALENIEVIDGTISGSPIKALDDINYIFDNGVGGEDSKFILSGNKLKLNFTPNYRNPIDADADNIYNIKLKREFNGAKFVIDYSRTRNEYTAVYTEEYASDIVNENGDDYYGFYSYNIQNNHAFAALKADGSITAWGDSSSGRLIPDELIFKFLIVKKKKKKTGSKIVYVCKDIKALNYEKFGKHKQSKCVYEENDSFIKDLEKVEDSGESKNHHKQCPVFTQYMKIGDRDGKMGKEKQQEGISPFINEVLLLQKVLNEFGFNPANNQDGVFGAVTKTAVKKFQERHRNSILAPWGISSGTGRFYQSTKRYMNELLGCPDSVSLDNGVYLSRESL